MEPTYERVDLTKKFDDLFSAEEGEVSVVNVPEFTFLTVTGKGEPQDNEDYEESIKMIYGIAFAIKFSLKRSPPDGFFDYKMPPMESLWWDTDKAKKNWSWKAMLMQPNYVTEEMVVHATDVAKSKHPDEKLPTVTYEKMHEGQAVQTLHVGAYEKEDKSIKLLLEEAQTLGYKLVGKHHEIYLNDLRRTRPEKLQTIIRYPVKEK